MKFIRTIGIALAALGLSTAGLAGTEPGRVWTHNTLSGSNFATQIGVGDRGGQLFTLIPGIGGKLRMLSGATLPGGEVIWELVPCHEIVSGSISSAEDAPIHAAVTNERPTAGAPRQLVLRVFGSGNAPMFTKSLAVEPYFNTYAGSLISRGGDRAIIWWVNAFTGIMQIKTYETSTGAELHTRELGMSFPPFFSTVDDSGRYAFFAGMGVDAGIDLDTGIVLLNLMSNGLNGQNTAISRSVPTVMAGTRSFTDHSAVQVYKRTDIPGATYPFTPWIMKDYYGSLWASTCALSPDGRYLAVGIMSYTLTGATGVDIYDLSLPSQDRIARIQPFPTAALEKTITKIAFIDGTTLACTASVSDNQPEAFTLQKTGSTWTLGLQAQSDVAPYALTPSRAGRFGVVSLGPDNSGTYMAQLTLYDASARNLELRSVPHAGTSADLRLYATPGSRAQVLLSTYLAPNPITFNNIGTLYVGTSGLIRVPAGIVPASGYLDMAFPMPAQPGQTRYLQSFATNPRQLGSSALQVTTVP